MTVHTFACFNGEMLYILEFRTTVYVLGQRGDIQFWYLDQIKFTGHFKHMGKAFQMQVKCPIHSQITLAKLKYIKIGVK